MEDFTNRGLGYRIDEENHQYLMANAQPSSLFTFGDINPANMGPPIGMIDRLHVEDQRQISSCAGNSSTTILEECLMLQSNVDIQLSRMFAYVNGQHYCGINGDQGATLEGVIKGFQQDGCPEEQYMPYTGNYYTAIPQVAREQAQKYKLKSWSPIQELQSVYEGLARRVGGLFLGIPCTQEIFNSPADGKLESYTPMRAGGHAMAIVDWCEEKDQNGYPYLLLANSWGRNYGYRGYRKVRPSALVSMMKASNSSFYLLSEMDVIKPRYDWSSKKWAA